MKAEVYRNAGVATKQHNFSNAAKAARTAYLIGSVDKCKY